MDDFDPAFESRWRAVRLGETVAHEQVGVLAQEIAGLGAGAREKAIAALHRDPLRAASDAEAVIERRCDRMVRSVGHGWPAEVVSQCRADALMIARGNFERSLLLRLPGAVAEARASMPPAPATRGGTLSETLRSPRRT